MVPRTVDADLDRVAAKLVVAGHQLTHPAFRIDHPPGELLQLVAEDIANLAKSFLVADRARTDERDPDVARRSHQFRVGVADVRLVYDPAAELLQDRTAGEAVVGYRRAPANAANPSLRFDLPCMLSAQSAAILRLGGVRPKIQGVRPKSDYLRARRTA